MEDKYQDGLGYLRALHAEVFAAPQLQPDLAHMA